MGKKFHRARKLNTVLEHLVQAVLENPLGELTYVFLKDVR
jgi:hypothetical protein